MGRWGTRSEERRVGKECRSRWWPCQAEDGILDKLVTGVQTCALPICPSLRGALLRCYWSAKQQTYRTPLVKNFIKSVWPLLQRGSLIRSGTHTIRVIVLIPDGAVGHQIGRASCRERV